MSPLRGPSGAGAHNGSPPIEILEALVTQLGLAGVAGLLGEIGSRRAEVLGLSGDDLKAAVWVHHAKILDRTARSLDGE